MPSSGCAASQALTAVPKPYQPGSISRHCAQLNTQGIARRSSMRVELLARGRTAADVELGDLADHRRLPEVALEARRLVDEVAIGRDRRASDSSSMAARYSSRGACSVRLQQRRLQRRGGEDLEVAPAELGVASICRRSPRPAR